MPRLPLIIFMALLIWLSPVSGARTYIVDDDGFSNYRTIQDAVIAASDGDTIYVKPGNYSEEVILNKSLSLMPLIGEIGPIILSGQGKETGMTVSSDGCNLEGLTFQGYSGAAVHLLSRKNRIENNVFEDASPAILASGSEGNSINGNLIMNCQGGVALRDASENNSIDGNEITSCNISIFLGEADGNSIIENNISDAYWGIWLDNSSQVQIEGNDIQSRSHGILLLNGSGLYVSDNLVMIDDAGNSTSRASLLANVSDVVFQRNEIDGGEIGLAALDCQNTELLYNNITQSNNAIYIQDAYGLNINNNSLIEGDYGIRVDNSSQNSIIGNLARDFVIALDIGAAEDNRILKNQFVGITDAAMQITSSGNCKILENEFTDGFRGIMLIESPANLLQDNRFQNVTWSLYVESQTKEGFNNSIDESNVVDFVPIAYLFDQSETQIRDRQLAHLTMAYCRNMAVDNITITRDAVFLFDSMNNSIINSNISECFGMRLINSSGNDILGNLFNGNGYSGLFLYSSDGNRIEKNVASENEQNGLSLLSCNQNIIRDNSVQKNLVTGIWLNLSNDNQIYENNITANSLGCQLSFSTGNTIYHNNFIDNIEHSIDTEGSNSWDAGNSTGGNYWSDHSARGNPSSDWPRSIKGGIAKDSYPFQDVNGWLAA
ncbi:NosD domain-containing protein [Methanothrix soehngenii]|uniref:NosD domain-containing protein n=1 Tax=Methanothrix soehngenii TaxID=2223 RepID=UPI00300D17D8